MPGFLCCDFLMDLLTSQVASKSLFCLITLKVGGEELLTIKVYV